MEPIDNLVRPIDGFHIEHGGCELSIHKVSFYLYALDEWHYACQKSHNALASNQPWHPWALKRNIWGERHVGKILSCQPIQIRLYHADDFIS
jgi:hypothetical protein